MKTYLALLGALLCSSILCLSQESSAYLSSRNWVERWVGSTNQTPETERIFVGTSTSSPAEYAVIVQYRKGITLREIIDQTRFQNAKLMVKVMRPNQSENKLFQNVTPVSHKSENEFFQKMAPLDTTEFEVKRGDVIWLVDFSPPLLLCHDGQ